MFVHPGAAPEPPPGDGRPVVILASGRQRVAARLLDWVTVWLAMTAPYLLVMAMVLNVDSARMPDALLSTMIVTCMIAMVWAWALLRIVRLVLWGCTVGQRIAGIRVVGYDGLRFPGWKQAFNRWSPTWGGRNRSSGLGPWSDVHAYWKDQRTRCCLHDKAAGTVVVQAPVREPARRIVLAATLPLAALAVVLAFKLIT
ncbi:hypothetical protein GCM10022254_29490 [Actinomadura meridiana]|uniref:RDD domain-containing protein n=1 Tax=Actinomadura meridiana TaxID=559626 RepID=A0ABP8C1U4_9ACTN